MKNNLLSLLILVVIGVAAYLVVQTVRSTTQSVSAPFQAISEQNQSMQTQVANLLHPTPTIIPDPVTYINDIRALARLETIQYSVEKVITGETGGGTFQALFGDKILFVAHGTVVAGIDMEKLKPEDMHYENGVLTVKLPPAEVLVATLDNDKSRVYQRDTGILAQPDPNLETLVRQKAEEEILKAALEDGILTHAKENAQAYLTRFFAALGFPNTVFVEDPG